MLTSPFYTDPTVTQSIIASLAAGASTILTIKPNQAQFRIPTHDDFGNVVSGVFSLSVVWDDVHKFGPITLTSDITSNGLTERLTRFMGPIRNYVQYTFTNNDSIGQRLEFTSWGLNINRDLALAIMGANFRDFAKMGFPVQPSQYSDVVGG